MLTYHKKIQEIKAQGPIDILRFQYDGKEASLRLVDESDDTIKLLTKWRTENWDGFDSKFEVTSEGTKLWIRDQILQNPNRILFLIIFNSMKIGQYGFSHDLERLWFGDLIKGERGAAPGIMEYVDKLFFKFAIDVFAVTKLYAKVFSDNFRTLNLHQKIGCIIVDTVPLKRSYTKDGWIWHKKELKSEEEYGERYFHIIEITRERLLKNFGDINYKFLIK